MKLEYIHSFRGIAIAFIVFGHALYFQFDWSNNQTQFYLLQDILSNGTVLFVFISGYLFQHLHGRQSHSQYYKSKFKNLLIPYIILSAPAIAFTVLIAPTYSELEVFQSGNLLEQVLMHYALGGAHVNYALWFMPMIWVMVSLAPFLAWILQKPSHYWVLLPMFALAWFIHRSPVPIVDVMRQVFYFIPVFITGMFISQYKTQIEPWFEKYWWVLLTLVTVLIMSQFLFSHYHGSLVTKTAYSSEKGWFDFQLLQKLFMCFLVIGLLRRFPNLNGRLLDTLAQYSFTIFFCHIYFFVVIEIIIGDQKVPSSLGLWFARGAIALLACCLLASIGKKFFGRYSRQLIAS